MTVLPQQILQLLRAQVGTPFSARDQSYLQFAKFSEFRRKSNMKRMKHSVIKDKFLILYKNISFQLFLRKIINIGCISLIDRNHLCYINFKMWHLVTIIFLLLCMGSVIPSTIENVDIKAIISLQKRNSRSEDTLFGHSVAIGQSGRSFYVYVGDPNDDVHGNVFRCGIDSSDNGMQSSYCTLVSNAMTKTNGKNLFGMAVTVKDERVVSCAHMEPNGYRFGERDRWPVERTGSIL